MSSSTPSTAAVMMLMTPPWQAMAMRSPGMRCQYPLDRHQHPMAELVAGLGEGPHVPTPLESEPFARTEHEERVDGIEQVDALREVTEHLDLTHGVEDLDLELVVARHLRAGLARPLEVGAVDRGERPVGERPTDGIGLQHAERRQRRIDPGVPVATRAAGGEVLLAVPHEYELARLDDVGEERPAEGVRRRRLGRWVQRLGRCRR